MVANVFLIIYVVKIVSFKGFRMICYAGLGSVVSFLRLRLVMGKISICRVSKSYRYIFLVTIFIDIFLNFWRVDIRIPYIHRSTDTK